MKLFNFIKDFIDKHTINKTYKELVKTNSFKNNNQNQIDLLFINNGIDL